MSIARTCLDGQAVVNGWLAIPDPFSAEIMAGAGFDALTIDLQHGLADLAEARAICQAIHGHVDEVFFRPSSVRSSDIPRMLDIGATGVICPMVQSRADAEQLVDACLYPPVGSRSFGPLRGRLVRGDEPFSRSDGGSTIVAMIETAEALENLDEILDVEGIHGAYVGPVDLAVSLGRPPQLDTDDERVLEALAYVQQRAAEHGCFAGMHCAEPDYAGRMFDLGFRFLTVGSDHRLLADASADGVRRVRGLTAGTQP